MGQWRCSWIHKKTFFRNIEGRDDRTGQNHGRKGQKHRSRGRCAIQQGKNQETSQLVAPLAKMKGGSRRREG